MIPSLEEAREITRLLLEENLIAAGNIDSIESIYWWEDEIHSRREWSLQCLTRRSLFEKVESSIINQHSYEVPGVIGIPIVEVRDEYSSWICQYTEQISENESIS